MSVGEIEGAVGLTRVAEEPGFEVPQVACEFRDRCTSLLTSARILYELEGGDMAKAYEKIFSFCSGEARRTAPLLFSYAGE
jgi:hypothetical protein